MTWDINNFATLLRYYKGGTVTFGGDSKGKIIGICNIKICSFPLIENVVLVEGLKHYLLSISQLCDKSFKIVFDDFSCDILDKKTNTRVLSGFRENNVYIIDMLNLDCNVTYLNAFNEDSWLWHRRLGDILFDHLSRINSKDLVKGNLGKFGSKSFEAIFVRYSNTRKFYRLFNRSTLTIKESMHVKFEESNLLWRIL